MNATLPALNLSSFAPTDQKPYTSRKPRAKAMTITAGFLCDSGKRVIIAADRQFTSPGFFKYHEPKYHIDSKGILGLTFAFAGDPGLFQEVSQKVCGFLDHEENESVEKVQSIVEQVINELNLRLTDSLFMLIGVNEIFEPPKLIVFNGKAVFIAENKVYTVGCGESSLIRYLGDQLYSPAMNENQGIALASYLIKKATQYVDYCGEPIDVICGDEGGFREVEPNKIKAAIEAMEGQEQFLSTLLVQKPFEL